MMGEIDVENGCLCFNECVCGKRNKQCVSPKTVSEVENLKKFLLQVMPCALDNRGIEKGYISEECLAWWNEQQEQKYGPPAVCNCLETKEGRCPAEVLDPLSHCRNCGRFQGHDHCCHGMIGTSNTILKNLQGYHLSPIPKGELGTLSKLKEELAELEDAVKQGSVVMALCELSDLVGAIEAYLTKNHPSVSIKDLQVMADITKRAFQTGERK